MMMNAKVFALLLALAVCVGHSQAMSVFGGGRCQCVRLHSAFIHPKHFRTLEVIPANANCNRVEVIATLKGNTNKQLCLNSDAPWVKKTINRMLDGAPTTAPMP